MLLKNCGFWAPPRKTMQNHLEITSKNQFWTRSVRNWTKTLTSIMSEPAKACQEQKSLSAKRVFPFLFFRNYTFPILISTFIFVHRIILFIKYNYHFLWNHVFYYANLWFLIKSCVSLSKFIMLCKIICFIKQIYDLLTKSCVWLSKFMIF